MSTKYTENQLVEGILRHGPEIVPRVLVELNSIEKYLSRINVEKLNYPVPLDSINTNKWYIPEEYNQLDIEAFLVDQCPTENYDRLITELQEYQRRNLIPLLKQMKYIVDTLRKNNVVWGVGRGSSVASYVLFLLGVHKIDSVKYKLPISEFFKGEENG